MHGKIMSSKARIVVLVLTILFALSAVGCSPDGRSFSEVNADVRATNATVKTALSHVTE